MLVSTALSAAAVVQANACGASVPADIGEITDVKVVQSNARSCYRLARPYREQCHHPPQSRPAVTQQYPSSHGRCGVIWWCLPVQILWIGVGPESTLQRPKALS